MFAGYPIGSDWGEAMVVNERMCLPVIPSAQVSAFLEMGYKLLMLEMEPRG